MPAPRTLTAAATAAVLAATACGCGADPSADAEGPGTRGSAGVARARSKDPREQFVHAPGVLGLPVRAAVERIAAARFAPEPGSRFGVESRAGSVVTFAPDEADDRPVTTQSPAHPQPSRYGATVALGTTSPALPGRRRPTLEELSWRRVAYEDGVVELSGVAWGGTCQKLDHVQVGPPGGIVRTVRIWATDEGLPVQAGCESAPGTVRIRAGNDWDPATSVWNGPLESPRADLRPVRPARYARITVQPDRRTVMVSYLRGACEALARATVAVRGRDATVDLRLGVVPPPADATRALCPSLRSAGTTSVRLAQPLPRRARFVDAPTGVPGA